jgi:hypothetical protein
MRWRLTLLRSLHEFQNAKRPNILNFQTSFWVWYYACVNRVDELESGTSIAGDFYNQSSLWGEGIH